MSADRLHPIELTCELPREITVGGMIVKAAEQRDRIAQLFLSHRLKRFFNDDEVAVSVVRKVDATCTIRIANLTEEQKSQLGNFLHDYGIIQRGTDGGSGTADTGEWFRPTQ